MTAPAYEKLGSFYLGRTKPEGVPLLYDSSDLVTHAVCVGMTGSGKTGLCISLIEEAAIDGIPAIVIDPKGDLSNLLLTFPSLTAEAFEPWVNPDEARNNGVDLETFASQQAELWRKGLAGWDEDGDRIRRLRESADFNIYTPGSDTGIPVSILKSFAAPNAATMADGEALRDRISGTATSLLGLAGIDADPVQSREHVLISNLLDHAWRQGEGLDLGALIARIQKPPMNRIGVLDLESFYPEKERFGLAMALNNLLASPGFEAWLQGEDLDIGKLLWTPAGKPRIAIFSIAHLADSERMFFVSLLLNQILGWMRSQPGTNSLRALLYMDEIFGYFPPVAAPPSKKPLLTLLKQARAFGLGVVLATQNPVDLDYKGLANAGTWFLGRLQTERDKQRVMDGLEGAAAQAGSQFDRQALDTLLSGLGKRVFLMNNVHETHPVLFETRWTLSYLRGPLGRTEIKRLTGDRAAAAAVPSSPAESVPSPATSATIGQSQPPVLPPGIDQYFIPVRGSANTYYPVVIGAASIAFLDAKAGVDETRDVVFTTAITDDPLGANWAAAEPCDGCAVADLEKSPEPGIAFAELPAAAMKPKNYAAWSKAFAAWLFREQQIVLLKSPGLGVLSMPGESERDFRVRLQQAARERRDKLKADLQAKYGPKLKALEARRLKAQQRREVERQQASGEMLSSAISVGATILGAFMGRRSFSVSSISRGATAVRSASRAAREYGDVGRATETLATIERELEDLNALFESEISALAEKVDPSTEAFESVVIRPKKTNIAVQLVALGWAAR